MLPAPLVQSDCYTEHRRRLQFPTLKACRDLYHTFSSVQLLSRVRFFATPCTAVRQASLSMANSQSLLKLISILSVMPSNHLLCCSLLVLPRIRVFSNVLHIRWLKYWSFSFYISPSNEISGVISLGWTGWISLHSKGLSSLLQHHSSKASILWRSSVFIVQLSHPYMLTGKTALTRRTFVGTPQLVHLVTNTTKRN